MLLWFIAIAGALVFAYRRYRLLEGATPTGSLGIGGDFYQFLNAARLIAAGHSPYGLATIQQGFGYVYTPLVALVLLPFCHAAVANVWHVWTAASLVSLIIFCALITTGEARRLQAWQRPLFFGFTLFTAFEFAPTTFELTNGQVDVFVLVAFAAAILAAETGWTATSGALIGASALIKTWPGGAALVMLRRGYTERRRTLTALMAALLIAPILALAIGGRSGLVDLIRVTFNSHSQGLPSLSVWGEPRLLFSSSGLARPVFVSSPVQDIATLVFVMWVLGLLFLTLRWSDSPALSFWNVVGCVVLLLPVSHLTYTFYLLPILWIWVARLITTTRPRGLALVIPGLAIFWWIISFRLNAVASTPTTSSLLFAEPFFANLGVTTASILGDLAMRIHSKQQ